MPEILTMIQIQRFTPTPAVLAMALLSMLYLTVSDIFALINYVGFATWVTFSLNSELDRIYEMLNIFPAEYWCSRFMFTMATMGPTKSTETN